MLILSVDSYLLEVKKLNTVKKLLKLRFLDNFLRQKGRNATKKIAMSLINLELLHLVQLNIILKWVHPFHWKQPPKPLYAVKISEKSDFQATYLKQKWRSATKTNEVTVKNLTWSYLAQLHIFWKLVHASHWK